MLPTTHFNHCLNISPKLTDTINYASCETGTFDSSMSAKS